MIKHLDCFSVNFQLLMLYIFKLFDICINGAENKIRVEMTIAKTEYAGTKYVSISDKKSSSQSVSCLFLVFRIYFLQQQKLFTSDIHYH